VRLLLFTDTLGDVNGVSRFVRGVAAEANAAGLDLRVVTSTRVPCEGADNIENFRPTFARAMPRYGELELAWPPVRQVLARAAALRPDAVHISTPGPVGLAGLLAARRLRVPVLGVYHTDFPAYVEHLFGGDWLLTRVCRGYMRGFYRRFAAVFTRSEEYERPLQAIGVERARVVRLRPGIDVARFQPSCRDESVWGRLGVPRGGAKVLYVGRVSMEKNLPLLASAWKRLKRASATDASLVVVGDGPYRAQMERELAGAGAYFPGFRHGAELSAIYASADVFAFPSATDTLGQVVMEAQSSGLPVLVSDRGGPREVVRGGPEGTGLVLQWEDAGAWCGALRGLLADDVGRRAMGARAHESMQGMTIRRSFEHFWSVHEGKVGCHKNETNPR
jgi:glycosyltransferase involved in cell wall biosynthesis